MHKHINHSVGKRYTLRLKEARQIVESWPGWKQAILGSSSVSSYDVTEGEEPTHYKKSAQK